MAANPQFHIPDVDRSEALRRHENAQRRAELYDQEPECTCQQTDVDMFDASGCDLHNRMSAWNVALRRVRDVERYEAATEEVSDVCPF